MKCLDASNDIKVYNLTASKSTPEWVNNKKKKKKSKKHGDLLQDFEMPDVSNCLKLSPDNKYLMVCGTYKPVVKCYDLAELSVKFERGMDAEVLRCEVLSEDYSKVAFLQEYRFIELHGQGGRVYRNRVPRSGRDIAMHFPSADLYIAASGNEIYRLNLFQGRFLNSLDANTTGINRLLFIKPLGVLTAGTDDGIVQCWDSRNRTKVGTLDCGRDTMEHFESFGEEIKSRKELRITSLNHDGPYTLAVGNYTGQILMYDIRQNRPYLVKDHHTRSPINSLHFHSSGNVFSMAESVVKIWDKQTGDPYTSFESETKLNDMQVVPETGLSFFAAEDKYMKAFFIPSIGPAPSWCSILDNMTEEMEDDPDTIVASQFDEFTFVTVEELSKLGLRDLIGTGMLRASMHGYYINTATYNKAKKLVNPVRPENVLKEKIKADVKEQSVQQVKPKKVVDNMAAVEKMLDDDKELIPKLLQDSRMASLLTSEHMSIQPELLNKMQRKSKVKRLQDTLKKRKAEIEREEKEFEETRKKQKEKKKEESLDMNDDSDVDSLVDMVLDD